MKGNSMLIYKPAQKPNVPIVVDKLKTTQEKLREAWIEFNKKRGVREWPREKFPKL
jgi:hypothetical protein